MSVRARETCSEVVVVIRKIALRESLISCCVKQERNEQRSAITKFGKVAKLIEEKRESGKVFR